MKNIIFGWLPFFAIILFSNGPSIAQEAQVLNPQFIQARELWRQLGGSSVATDIKAEFGSRFGNLAREQQRLWSLAGQVDHGACTGGCLSAYNNSIDAWQLSLQRFDRDANEAMEMFQPRPGRWKEYGDWHQFNVRCFQKYVCVPNQTFVARSGTYVVSTPADGKTQWGYCQVGKPGDPGGCGECRVNPPTDRCEWHLKGR